MADQEEDQGIAAYHGSPHEFEQFDLSKIGTGEGAQAYGHGLYFAEREGIAKDYRNRLATETRAHNTFDGQKLTPSIITKLQDHPDRTISNFFKTHGKSPSIIDLRHRVDDKIEAAQDEIDTFKDRLEKHLANPPFASTYGPDDYRQRIANNERYLQSLQNLRSRLDHVKAKKNAHMYEVNINAHPDHFLDWDAPLSENPDHVKNAVSNVIRDAINDAANPNALYAQVQGARSTERADPENPMGMSGAAIHDMLSRVYGHEMQSKKLLEHGIKGIKYLDAASRRDSDKPTRNYVVFDDKLVNVKRRYAHGGEVQSYAGGGSIGIGGIAAFGDPSKGPNEYGVTTPMEAPGDLLMNMSPEQREYLSSEMTKQMNANPSSTANSPLAAGIESYDADAAQARDDARRAEQQALRDAAVQRAAGTTVVEKAPQATGMFAPPAQTTAFGSGVRDVGFPKTATQPFAKAPVSQTSDTRAAPKTIRQNFNQAFADAKAAGLKQFTWVNPATGKAMVYTTQLARKEGGRVPSLKNPNDWIAEVEKPRQTAKPSSVRKPAKVEGTAIVKRALMLSSRKS